MLCDHARHARRLEREWLDDATNRKVTGIVYLDSANPLLLGRGSLHLSSCQSRPRVSVPNFLDSSQWVPSPSPVISAFA